MSRLFLSFLKKRSNTVFKAKGDLSYHPQGGREAKSRVFLAAINDLINLTSEFMCMLCLLFQGCRGIDPLFKVSLKNCMTTPWEKTPLMNHNFFSQFRLVSFFSHQACSPMPYSISTPPLTYVFFGGKPWKWRKKANGPQF